MIFITRRQMSKNVKLLYFSKNNISSSQIQGITSLIIYELVLFLTPDRELWSCVRAWLYFIYKLKFTQSSLTMCIDHTNRVPLKNVKRVSTKIADNWSGVIYHDKKPIQEQIHVFNINVSTSSSFIIHFLGQIS